MECVLGLPMRIEIDGDDACGVLHIDANELRVHLKRAQLCEDLVTKVVIAHACDDRGASAQRLRMAGEVARRAAHLATAWQHIP